MKGLNFKPNSSNNNVSINYGLFGVAVLSNILGLVGCFNGIRELKNINSTDPFLTIFALIAFSLVSFFFLIFRHSSYNKT